MCILAWWTLSKGETVGVDLSYAVEGVVADEEDDVVEEAPGERGPKSIGVFKGLTARELNKAGLGQTRTTNVALYSIAKLQ